MNYLYSDWSNYEKYSSNNNNNNNANENVISTDPSYEDEKLYLPFTGNGYIGIAINSNRGIYAYHQKSLGLPVKYNPIAQISSDTLIRKGKKIKFK